MVGMRALRSPRQLDDIARIQVADGGRRDTGAAAGGMLESLSCKLMDTLQQKVDGGNARATFPTATRRYSPGYRLPMADAVIPARRGRHIGVSFSPVHGYPPAKSRWWECALRSPRQLDDIRPDTGCRWRT